MCSYVYHCVESRSFGRWLEYYYHAERKDNTGENVGADHGYSLRRKSLASFRVLAKSMMVQSENYDMVGRCCAPPIVSESGIIPARDEFVPTSDSSLA